MNWKICLIDLIIENASGKKKFGHCSFLLLLLLIIIIIITIFIEIVCNLLNGTILTVDQ